MISRLRSRFVRIAMFAVILVLFLIIGTINILNYRSVVTNADSLLQILAAHGSSFPGSGGFLPDDRPPEGSRPDGLARGDFAREDRDPEDFDPEEREDDDVDPEDREDDDRTWIEEMEAWNQSLAVRTGGRGAFSEETPFESRYFLASFASDGSLLSFDITHIAAIEDEEDLLLYTDPVLSASGSSGFQGQYRYLKITEDGQTTILFLDCSRSLANFRSFLLLSLFVSILGLAGILVLIVLLSGRIVRPVQESYEKQKRFITDAGHELKTPLTIIDADVMVAEMETGESEWLNDVKAQTKRLAELTNDLIYLSRMDEGTQPLQRIDFPLSDVVAEILQSFRSRIQLEEKTLTTAIEPMLTCNGDENALRKLVSILLDNAVKYAKEKGEISVSLLKKSRHILLIVENEVDTLDPTMLQHMFDRFYRADASRNSARGGHGIGLSIAQAVIAAHKGSITAEAAAADRLRITAALPL